MGQLARRKGPEDGAFPICAKDLQQVLLPSQVVTALARVVFVSRLSVEDQIEVVEEKDGR